MESKKTKQDHLTSINKKDDNESDQDYESETLDNEED